MKPRRKAVSNGAATEKTERRRSEFTTPGRRKSSLSESIVCPPPEYFPFNYEDICKKFKEVLAHNEEDFTLRSKDLTHLQHDLEQFLTFSADSHLRAIGEVAFLTSGDYPTVDLENRPMPVFTVREVNEPSPGAVDEDPQGICGLPVDHINDDIDFWPPHHIPTRFWKWCMLDTFKPIDINYLKEFKATFMDKTVPDNLSKLYVNEPWKYKKRPPAVRTRLLSNGSTCGSPAGKRRLSVGSCEEKSKEAPPSKKRCMRDRPVPPVISNMVDVVCREIVESDDRSTEKNEKEEEAVMAPDFPVKNELFPDEGEPGCSKTYQVTKGRPNGSSPGPLNISVPGPSHAYAYTDPDQQCSSKDFLLMEAHPGPSSSMNGYLPMNGQMNNGFGGIPMNMHMGMGGMGPMSMNMGMMPMGMQSHHPSYLGHMPGCSGHCDEDYKTYISIGEEVLGHLIDKELVPDYAANVYEHMVKGDPDVEISTEGKQDDDDDELDEVSEELRRCQQELKAMEPDLRGIVDFAWNKLVSDFAWWETNAQLDDLDNTLFRLAVNTYREFPRRLPTREEWPALCTAMRRRNEKARLHYGKWYKRNPDFFEENAPEVANSDDLKP